jgi:hypothetical protein
MSSLTGLKVIWASTDPGTVSIMATAGNVANSVLLTVSEPSPAAVLVRPGSVRIHHGGRMGHLQRESCPSAHGEHGTAGRYPTGRHAAGCSDYTTFADTGCGRSGRATSDCHDGDPTTSTYAR